MAERTCCRTCTKLNNCKKVCGILVDCTICQSCVFCVDYDETPSPALFETRIIAV
jgi:hypothetical protein